VIERRLMMKCSAMAAIAGSIASFARRPAEASEMEWSFWKGAYTEAGRVIDGPQGDVSHSEGQGYGMLLALAYNDRPAFDSYLDWAVATLRIRDDGLFAWRWRPDGEPAIDDTNNASDGDLLIAWAAARAAARFQDQYYMDLAQSLSETLVERCMATDPATGRRFLLPAVEGFQRAEGPVLNPSYIIPLALRELAAATGIAELEQLADDGSAILADLAVNGLPPDWVQMTADGPAPAEALSNHAGYDALRVPLYLIWDGQAEHPAVARWNALWSRTGGDAMPTVVESGTGVVLEESPNPGYRATPALVSCILGDERGSAMPRVTLEEPYFPATLSLLSRIAQREKWPRCAPL
jgi:endoglucanase